MIEDEIRQLLDKIAAQTRRDYANMLREFQLHVGQDNMLCQLWRGDGITQQQLCENLNCEPSTVTNMLNTLEKNEIVYRQRDAADARISRVYLTAKGASLEQPVRNVWMNQQEKLLQGILPEERLLLRRLLMQMEDNL
ncbi:MarR family transcriptional regulator [Paenibacillus sp. BIHB 4019]|uniref:MarR family transcriptional regulator n=1 Tax=Paenibacillus sp. BIHB 4019 TaxID=1870819 RepID=A0A1B2DSE3_9BACL|nr:MarR family transcriptional regulator [Paenibacillus sp. BIHB 4019]ANY70617.1 MarR family transcriptional regulator [Paenibacillus sp. BIHB 4019]